MRYGSLLHILILSVLLLTVGVSCTLQEKDFATEACLQNNLNCTPPSTTIDLVGGDENRDSVEVDGSGNEVGSVSVKGIRYGENTIIEFIVTNPKLNPLKDFSLAMTPVNPAFEMIAGRTYPSCTDNLLVYQEKCAVAIKYKPARIPPGQVQLAFNFKTITGADFSFKSGFDPAVLIADFYIEPASLALPTTMIYSGTSGAATTEDIKIENTSSTTGDDLTISSLKLLSGGSCELTAPSADACTPGTVLSAHAADPCNIKIKFRPTHPGEHFCLFEILGTNGAYRTYTFRGMGSGFTSDKSQIDFGIVKVSSAAKTSQLRLNLGLDSLSTAASNCSLTSEPSDNAFEITTTPSSLSSLPAGSIIDIEVKYTPQATPKSHQTLLNLSCDDRGGEIKIPLYATSTNSILTSNLNTVQFGDVLVGETKRNSITLNNISTFETISNLTNSLHQQLGTEYSIASSTCASTLLPLQSCTVDIEFKPASRGLYNGSFSSIGGLHELSPSITLQGHGRGLKSSLAAWDFGSLPEKKDRPGPTIIITNDGPETIQGCSLNTTNLKKSNFSVDDDSTCLTTTQLAAGASCEIKPRFSAGAPEGLKEAQLQMSCAKGGAVAIPLRGEVTPNLKLVLLPQRIYDWQDRLVGISENIEFTFMNQDSEALNNLSFTENGLSGPWSKVSNTCTTTLNSQTTCKQVLKYNPSATPGAEQVGTTTGSIIGQGTGANAQTASFSSTAKKISVNSASINFGQVVTNKSYLATSRVYFTNPSGTDIASSCALSSLSHFAVENTDCGSSLTQNSQCSVLLKHPAKATTGALSESLHYTCTIGGRASVSVSAQVIDPKITITGDGNFGQWDLKNGPLSKTFTITNQTPEAVTLSTPSLQGTGGFAIASNNCTAQLEVAASCQVQVHFDPSAIGEASGKLSVVVNNNTDTGIYSADLLGFGTQMNLSLSVVTRAFNPIRLGSSDKQTQPVVITNNGNRVANLSYSSLQSPFTKTGDCGATLAVGASCTLEVHAESASLAANHSETLTVTESQGSASDNHSVLLTGATWNDARFAIKDNRAQSSFTNSDIALTDITGDPDDSNNIVELSPASRSVEFTIKNDPTLAFPFKNIEAELTRNDGPAPVATEPMQITSNTCPTNNDPLEAGQSCTITVRYMPTAVRETDSDFTLTITGQDDTYTRTIKSIKILGQSFKQATLEHDLALTNYDFGLISADTSVIDPTTITLRNIGDVKATNLSFNFSGTISGFSTHNSTCTTFLAGGANCSFQLAFKPNNVAMAIKSTFSINSDQSNLNSISTLKGASYIDYQQGLPIQAGTYDVEHEIASDDTHFFITSKNTDNSTYRTLNLKICDKNSSTGNVEVSSCKENILNITNEPYWAGAFVGYKLNPQVTAKKILVASSNQQNDSVNLKGISSILICDKNNINVQNEINLLSSGCSIINLHDISVDHLSMPIAKSNKGAFTAMKVYGNKAVFSSQHEDGYTITSCSFDDDAVPSNSLQNCKTHFASGLGLNKAEYTDIDYDGNHIVMTAHSLGAGLYAVVCTSDSVNNLNCGPYALVDNDSIIKGPSTMIAGAHPYIVMDQAGIFIASQQGAEKSQGLRMAKCSIAGMNLNCTNKTIATAINANGFGLNPSIKIIERGAERIAWVQSVFLNDYASIAGTLKKITLHSCSATNFTESCSTAYFTQTTASTSPIYAREMVLDKNNRTIMIPFSTNTQNKTGFLTIGLLPEL